VVGVWRVSRLLQEAFADSAQYRRARRGVVRAVMLVLAVAGEWRMNADATAVYFISPPPLRRRVYAALLAAATCAVLWVTVVTADRTAWVSLPVLGGLLWLAWPLVKPSLASARLQRRLNRTRPAGRTVLVHSVASVRRGAGAELLRELHEQADANGWILVLDAANETVADKVYRPLGYVPTGPGVATPAGPRQVPMARYPCYTGRPDEH
jgi:hypothetical protein